MPIDLPPVVEHAPAPASQAPLAGQIPSTLAPAYDDLMKAWGARWVGVQVHVAGAALPVGLQQMLNRHNPALSQALAQQGASSTFALDPTLAPAVQAQLLKDADGRMLDLLHAQGWLTTRPLNAITTAEGSEAGRVFTTTPTLQLSASPESDFPQQVLSRGMDPVALRWFVLCHEAAHIEMEHRPHVFHEVSWSPEQNAAMNTLFFDNPGNTSLSAQVFSETFADVYGAMMALSVTEGAPAMRQTLAGFQALRREKTADVEAGFKAAVAKGENPLWAVERYLGYFAGPQIVQTPYLTRRF